MEESFPDHCLELWSLDLASESPFRFPGSHKQMVVYIQNEMCYGPCSEVSQVSPLTVLSSVLFFFFKSHSLCLSKPTQIPSTPFIPGQVGLMTWALHCRKMSFGVPSSKKKNVWTPVSLLQWVRVINTTQTRPPKFVEETSFPSSLFFLSPIQCILTLYLMLGSTRYSGVPHGPVADPSSRRVIWWADHSGCLMCYFIHRIMQDWTLTWCWDADFCWLRFLI